MITLANGVRFEYMAASGALAWDGRGWLWDRLLERAGKLDTSLFLAVTPSLTLEPRQGNLSWLAPWRCVRPIVQDGKVTGFVNAKGLTNPGIRAWLVRHEPLFLGRAMVVSIYADRPADLRIMAQMLDKRDIAAVELNASCPNSGETYYQCSENIVNAAAIVREYCRHPLIVKLSCTQDLEFLADALGPYAAAFSINSVPWSVVFPDRPSPLARLGGGAVSGKVAQRWTWRALERLNSLDNSWVVPLIGPSAWEYGDIAELRHRGARAISFGSVLLRYPHRVTEWVRRDIMQSIQGGS